MAYRHPSSSVDFTSPYAIRHRSAASSPILETEEEHYTNASDSHWQDANHVQTPVSSRNLVSGQIVPPTFPSPSNLSPSSRMADQFPSVRSPKNRRTYPLNSIHGIGGTCSSDPGFGIPSSDSNMTDGRTTRDLHSQAFMLDRHSIQPISRSDMNQPVSTGRVVVGRRSLADARTTSSRSSAWSKEKKFSEDLACGEVSPGSGRGSSSSPVKQLPGASTNAVRTAIQMQMQMQAEARAIPSQEQEALPPLDTPRATTLSIMTREPSSSKPSIMVFSESTTDRLTRRFPIHPTVRNLPVLHEYAADRNAMSGRRSGSGSPTRATLASALLDESGGLGVERVDKWSGHKWCLLFSVCSVLVYGLLGLTCALLTWFKAWEHADVMSVADYDILILITISSSILLLTFLIGITGTILNSRPILAIYSLLLWPALFSMLAIGYTSYKRYAFSLDRKLNLAWSEWYTPLGRLIIQNSLRCCGFYSPLHSVTPSKKCYSRTPLPGCKAKLYNFERNNLGIVWAMTFSLVPLHLLNIFVALLCSNHVTRLFGKGITPREYRLCGDDLRVDAEKIFPLGTTKEENEENVHELPLGTYPDLRYERGPSPQVGWTLRN